LRLSKTLFCILLSGLLSFSTAFAADNPPKSISDREKEAKQGDLFSIIRDFGRGIYKMAELNGGSPEQWDAAEAKTLAELKFAMAKSDDAMSKLDNKGRTPLMMASYLGYDFIVETLLQHDSVHEILEITDKSGLTAYGYSLIAFSQTLQVCHPTIENAFVLVPFLVTQPYYIDRDGYTKTAKLLKASGANTDEDPTREIFLKVCSNDNQEFLNKVKTTDDLQGLLLSSIPESE